MNSNAKWLAGLALAIGVAGSIAVACTDDSSAVHETVTTDSGTTTPGTDSSTPATDGAQPTDGGPQPDDCVMNPTTNIEIINACTDAAKYDKNPTLPLLLPDGGLPPLS